MKSQNSREKGIEVPREGEKKMGGIPPNSENSVSKQTISEAGGQSKDVFTHLK